VHSFHLKNELQRSGEGRFGFTPNFNLKLGAVALKSLTEEGAKTYAKNFDNFKCAKGGE
jgi:hypothetical protein